jgi:Flp pilus assembly protein TadD
VAHFNLGLALFQNEQLEGAAEAFRGAIAADPAQGDAYFMLGNVLLRQGDSSGARESYQKFLEVSPDSPNAAAAREAIAQLKPQ